jgi:Holliday junction resolvase
VSGRFSRDKGARGEREAAHALAEWLGIKVERAARNGVSTFDLYSDSLSEFAVEVKYLYETPAVEEWWRQAIEQSDGRIPLLMYRFKHKAWRLRLPIGALTNDKTPETEPWVETNLAGFAWLWQHRNG